MTNENSLQTFILFYTQIKNAAECLKEILSSFNEANNLKNKIDLSVKIKRIETLILYKTSHFSNFYITNRNDIDKKYAKKLIKDLEEEITNTNAFKKKILMQKHKSRFLQKLKEKSSKNEIESIIVTDDLNETETDDSLIFI